MIRMQVDADANLRRMELIEFGLEIQTGSANLRDHSQGFPTGFQIVFQFFVGQVGQVGDCNGKKP